MSSLFGKFGLRHPFSVRLIFLQQPNLLLSYVSRFGDRLHLLASPSRRSALPYLARAGGDEIYTQNESMGSMTSTCPTEVITSREVQVTVNEMMATHLYAK